MGNGAIDFLLGIIAQYLFQKGDPHALVAIVDHGPGKNHSLLHGLVLIFEGVFRRESKTGHFFDQSLGAFRSFKGINAVDHQLIRLLFHTFEQGLHFPLQAEVIRREFAI